MGLRTQMFQSPLTLHHVGQVPSLWIKMDTLYVLYAKCLVERSYNETKPNYQTTKLNFTKLQTMDHPTNQTLYEGKAGRLLETELDYTQKLKPANKKLQTQTGAKIQQYEHKTGFPKIRTHKTRS